MLVDARLGNIAAGDAEAHARELEERSYSIHFHVWNRAEFGQMLELAGEVYDLPLELVELAPNRHEFIVVLRKQNGRPA
jgi:hypothetical protein